MWFDLTVLISSSCSTDETVVADSDVEAQTSSLVNATSAATTEEAPKYLRKDEIFVNYANNSMTGSREKAKEADVVVLTEEAPKYLTIEEISINHANSSMAESREKVDEADTQVLSKEPPKYLRKEEISINHANNSMTRCREKADESECEHSVVIYSQDLVVRDLNLSATFSSTATNGVINFKCFRKVLPQNFTFQLTP
ncbi:hypothetical protein Patl1_32450 [Pistacia atlantica]|uniref:Uncharacterized protein n=1 Tax=Pistacia atlantica TaxID=434234 RepID=A0ACC1ARQ1_9ROSI|nr:hypothetical protein Patl1_32450 [Pistacia atlantica]